MADDRRLRKYKVGILGTGFAEVHLELIEQTGQIETTWLGYKNNKKKAERLAQKYNISHITNNSTELIKSDVDMVVIVTPVNTHYELIKSSLLNGKFVVCDKPLCLNINEAQELIDISRDVKVPVMVFFQWRFNKYLNRLRKILQSEALGNINNISMEFYHDFMANPSFPWTWRNCASLSGMGAFTDMGVHLIDLVHWLFNKDLDIQSAKSKVFYKERQGNTGMKLADTEDVGQILFTFAEAKIVGSLTVCRVSAYYRSLRVLISGELGTVLVELNPNDGSGILKAYGGVNIDNIVGQEVEENPYAHWIDYLNNNGAEIPTIIDGFAAQNILEKIAKMLQAK